MIQRMKNSAGSVAKFGKGTVRVRAYTLKTRYGGQVELTECVQTKIGTAPVEKPPVSGTAKIVLDFTSVDSVDVLILKLRQLREEMLDESVVFA